VQQEFFFHVLHEEGTAVRPRRTVKDGSNSTWTVPKRAIEPGPSDGFVCEYAVAELRPVRDGKFALDLPDFANDGAARSYHGPADRAEWSFSAWEGHTARDQLSLYGQLIVAACFGRKRGLRLQIRR
jgi:hypothetical protein